MPLFYCAPSRGAAGSHVGCKTCSRGLAKRIEDMRCLKLIRGYLDAGMLANVLTTERNEGTPQDGRLSKLLKLRGCVSE